MSFNKINKSTLNRATYNITVLVCACVSWTSQEQGPTVLRAINYWAFSRIIAMP